MGLIIGWAAILYVRALYKVEDLFGAWRRRGRRVRLLSLGDGDVPEVVHVGRQLGVAARDLVHL